VTVELQAEGEDMRIIPKCVTSHPCVVVLLVALFTLSAHVTATAPPPPADPQQLEAPFVGGSGGYPVYRIPSLVVTPRGTLLAFAEGRAARKDQSENDIVLRRSTDGGHTWGDLQVVAEDGHNSLNNPTAVVLPDGEGRVLLMYQRYPAASGEFQVGEGVAGDGTCLCFITSSDDDGRTWAKPVDVTAQVKRPTGATSIASGPGIGIQLRHGKHAGRVIIPFNQGPLRDCQVYAAFSDDAGRSWKYGAVAPTGADGRGNEVQMVELSDGRVMLNSRGSSGKLFRKVAVSGDGGETWSELRDDPALPESRCEASAIRYEEPAGGRKGILLFSNPAVTKGRTHGTVRLSEDDGATWAASRELVVGDFAYSCLAVLPDRSVVCLYETDGYRRIALVRFTINWVRGGSNSGPARP
jgi:sialidase-1